MDARTTSGGILFRPLSFLRREISNNVAIGVWLYANFLIKKVKNRYFKHSAAADPISSAAAPCVLTAIYVLNAEQ